MNYRNCWILLAIGLTLVTPAIAQDGGVTFSRLDKGLKLTSFDARTATHLFEGKVVVTGTVVFEMDMASPEQASGDVNFAKFIPDPASRRRLPAVASPLASPIRYVLLEPAEVALEGAVGKDEAKRLSHGASSSVSRRVRVAIRTYRTSIECDARNYWATIDLKDMQPLRETVASIGAPPGC